MFPNVSPSAARAYESIGKRQSAEREVGFQTPAGLTLKGLKITEENVLPCFVVTSANV